MESFLKDPMGCKLIKSNQPKKDKSAEKKDGGGGGGGGGAAGAAAGVGFGNGINVSNCFYAGPTIYPTQPAGFCQIVNGYPQMFPQMLPPPVIAVAQPAAPEKPKDKGPPPHVCVACNAKNKCKKCLQKEEEEKNYVIKQSFASPRSSYRPSIFSNKIIRA